MSKEEAERFGKTVAAQLRAEAAAQGITVVELARRSGINRETLDRWLKGERAISVPTMFQLAQVLGVDPFVVVKRAEERFETEGTDAKVTKMRPSKKSVGGSTETDLHKAPYTGREAATRGNTPIDPERENS
jgi:transcriptional regulator with XRE-family HTH domain